VISRTVKNSPIYDLTAADDVQHTIWMVEDATGLASLFEQVDHLYVADGHHRCKAASRAAAEVAEEGEVRYFPAVLFPMGDMKILAYNRIIRQLPESPEAFLESLRAKFALTPALDPVPTRKGDICLYIGGSWHAMTLPASEGGVVDDLDVGRLSDAILRPMLFIDDPRTDANIDFVGGIRGTKELERVVDSGLAQLAISMYPTSIEELVGVSDAGQLMPPKSTWFEPKLRSGLLVHLF